MATSRRGYNSSQSTLLVRQPALGSSFFDAIWNSISNFISYLFSFFSGPSIATADIARISNKGFVYFYNHKNPMTAWMGNFHPCRIHFHGLTFSCAEAAFQASKFAGKPALQARFVGLNGDQAFRLARSLSHEIRPDWHHIKERVMYDVLEAKYAQHPDLARLLLCTGDAYLVEHNEVVGRDTIWSDNHDGTGQNRLGILSMQIRLRFGGAGAVPAPRAYYSFLRTGL